MFFQSILLGTEFTSRHEIVNDAQRFAIWPEGSSHPRTLTMDDLPAMLESEKLFARKFDASVDSAVLGRARGTGWGANHGHGRLRKARLGMPQSDYRALVAVTTCQRLRYLRRYLPHLARFCARDPRFSLLVALDGTEADTLGFCEEWEVPLLYADAREGVGISKNRVLERYPDFDYYFFLEDDVELVDGSVFPAHVELSRASGIHHFSLFECGGVRKPTSESDVAGHRVVQGLFGSADFGFYTGAGLSQVGGWHPRFAEYRRWGHTEHSYRFYRAGLAPAPFTVAKDMAGACIWHYPSAVTRVQGVPVDGDEIAAPERELIDQELRYVPVQTLVPAPRQRCPVGSSQPACRRPRSGRAVSARRRQGAPPGSLRLPPVALRARHDASRARASPYSCDVELAR